MPTESSADGGPDRAVAAPFAAALAAADRCVLCGMCLPHCPTYAAHRDEGDAPRGRITLMQGLAQGRLDPGNERLRAHLEGCLGCRSCEAVCPARVPFAALMDATRTILRENPARRWHPIPDRLVAPLRNLVLRRRSARRFAALAARTAHWLGLRHLLPARSRLGRVLRHTGPSLRRMPALPAPTGPDTADVLLFTGCMDAFFTGPDAAAALEVLSAFGLQVWVPRNQVCCGALDQHLGRPAEADALRRRNEAAFGTGTRPILALDSGCEAQLREYPQIRWQQRVTSLTALLAELPADRVRWRDDPVRVALHLPCTLRNVTRETAGIRRLLERLPGVTLAAVTPPGNCCGAAGTAMLSQPALADSLGRPTLAALAATGADVIVSPNVGCSVHLRALQTPESLRMVSPAAFLRERLPPRPGPT
ncbi:glycolate oxidase iron-sulfur subunit [Thioalkalivibrio nitratireducens DSM 14787]|uniref:Glycolate oxidase iron-sulfur subunit n=1 Tax=Thioalkalivibrio nitratireducens (strain DSM 14787 / UNIQEM 213 / ALEN2) TaxID=1255043 RepID=L0DST3_THIND|nr:(Fe-S)-binding protein [Thioalkalivibrio nitratireducens]AGA32073.1 glycolate oxidase iron-sulfur subunit [Thioalkalivibrio nitratireducens DSM 14787]